MDLVLAESFCAQCPGGLCVCVCMVRVSALEMGMARKSDQEGGCAKGEMPGSRICFRWSSACLCQQEGEQAPAI